MTPKLKITQTNKQADFKPESKNLMLSLVLFTLFPSLEMTSTLNNALRQHGADENDDKAAEPQIKHQTTILLIAVFKPEPKNLMLSLVLFTLFPSLEQFQWWRQHGTQAEVAATMKTMLKLLNPKLNTNNNLILNK